MHVHGFIQTLNTLENFKKKSRSQTALTLACRARYKVGAAPIGSANFKFTGSLFLGKTTLACKGEGCSNPSPVSQFRFNLAVRPFKHARLQRDNCLKSMQGGHLAHWIYSICHCELRSDGRCCLINFLNLL